PGPLSGHRRPALLPRPGAAGGHRLRHRDAPRPLSERAGMACHGARVRLTSCRVRAGAAWCVAARGGRLLAGPPPTRRAPPRPPPPQLPPALPRSHPPPLLPGFVVVLLRLKLLPQLLEPQEELAERESPAVRDASEDWSDCVVLLLLTLFQLPLLYSCQPLPVFR